MKRYFQIPWQLLLGSACFFLSSVSTLWAQNLTGRITAEGKGVSGVAVSDGFEVVLTDEEGRYALQSNKKNGYVFFSLPRGYEPEYRQGFLPAVWASLQSEDVLVNEEHHFSLVKQSHPDRYVMILGADTHLADRSDDLEQFCDFTDALRREVDRAKGRKVYSMLLGDLSWDNYWQRNHFGLPEFLRTCAAQRYAVPLWPVMGNHDHDPSVPSSATTDYQSAAQWRRLMGPNYYSYNIGRVHYVVLDDIVYKNEDTGTKYSAGVVGARNYDGAITDEQLAWLEKDLACVTDKSTPVVVALHIPIWRLNVNTLEVKGGMKRQGSERLCHLLRDFKDVHIVSGHTHINYTAHPEAYPNVTEHNIAAVCAVWWNTAPLTGLHNTKDGVPGGYSRWEVDGKKLRWTYCSQTPAGEPQMRIYDMNTVAKRYREDAVLRKILKKYPQRQDYSTSLPNEIRVNVFAYDVDWKVEIRENGRQLKVERVAGEDPFHVLAYDRAAMERQGKIGEGSSAGKTAHLFRAVAQTADRPVTVRVTDSFGRKYVRSIRRPHAYDLEMEQREVEGRIR